MTFVTLLTRNCDTGTCGDFKSKNETFLARPCSQFVASKTRGSEMKSAVVIAMSALLLSSELFAGTTKAEGRRFFAGGANGRAGGCSNAGNYGQRAGVAAIGAKAGLGVRGGQYYGPNGGTAQSGSAFGYKRGVGAFRSSGWSGTAPNGASGYGNTTNKYNAQTGQGVRSSNEQVTSSSGQNYGFNGTSDYTKGVGDSSVINTDNKGSYDVNWAKGSKPVVTPAN
jgi:hypothetical protein